MSNAIKRHGVTITINPFQDVDDLIVYVCLRFTDNGRRMIAYVAPDLAKVAPEQVPGAKAFVKDLMKSRKIAKRMIGGRRARLCDGIALIYSCDQRDKPKLMAAATNYALLEYMRGVIVVTEESKSPRHDKITLGRIHRMMERTTKEATEDIFGLKIPSRIRPRAKVQQPLRYGLLDT